jgi:hypothetical protein
MDVPTAGLAWAGADLSAECGGSLGHAAQAVTTRTAGLGIDDAVVCDVDQKRVRVGLEDDPGVGGRCMAHHVGERFLDDAVAGLSDGRFEQCPLTR